MNTNEVILRRIDWAQFTPLLINADKVFIDKYKIDAKGIVTKDTKQWALHQIVWQFSPIGESQHSLEIKSLDDKGEYNPDTAEEEVFDFLTGAFKFYYNTETNEIWGEIEASNAGLIETYRYIFKFYGTQTVEAKDLLVNQSFCTKSGIKTLNSVIAL